MNSGDGNWKERKNSEKERTKEGAKKGRQEGERTKRAVPDKNNKSQKAGLRNSGTKFLVLLFGAFAVFFTGYPHIWSIYQPYAMEAAGWSQNQASMCFYLYFVTFVLGNILGGRIQDHYNPRIPIIAGGGIFTGSILLCSLALRPSPLFMYGTYGVLQGLGQGMIYTTIISTAQKWFPEKTGFASGVIVTANGLFGFFMAPVSRTLLSARGIKSTFLIIGVLIGISWILASVFVNNPDGEIKIRTSEKDFQRRQYKAGEMIKTRKFYYLLGTMLFGLLPYLILSPLSQTVQLNRGIPASVAMAAVMAGSVFNAGTRLALPTAADKVGRIICLKGVLAVAVLAMLMLVFAPAKAAAICVVLVYACYGGIMGSFPSLTSHIFGLSHTGENYGYVMLGMAAATLSAPVITSTVARLGFDSNMIFIIGAVCALFSFGFLFLLEGEMKQEEKGCIAERPHSFSEL